MNKRSQKKFARSFPEARKKQNYKPLIYACGGFAIFLFIWVVVINSDSDDLAPAARDSIIKERQAVKDLKEEVYTRDDKEHDDTEGASLQGLPTLVNMAPGVGTFIIIIAVFGGVAAIIYAMVGVVRTRFK